MVILVIALIFYGIVPAIGAVYKRHFWRRFRLQVFTLHRYPLTAALPNSPGFPRKNEEAAITCHFFGELESFDSGGRASSAIFWLRSKALTVPVDSTGALICMIPKGQTVQQVRRKQMLNTAELGNQVYVGGKLGIKDGRPIFMAEKGQPLHIIFFPEGIENFEGEIAARGRQQNEYWNKLTPYALTIGVCALLFYSVSLLSRPATMLPALIAFLAIFMPVYPMLPPGFIFSFGYRVLRLQAYLLRVRKDSLALRMAKHGKRQKARRAISRCAYLLEAIAWLCILAALVVNLFFIAFVASILLGG